MASPEKIRLYDKDDQLVDEVTIPAGYPETEPRSIIWQGRKFIEGGSNSFYGRGEFGEVVPESVQ